MTDKIKMLCPRCQQTITYEVMQWGYSGDCQTCWSHTMIQTGVVPVPVMKQWVAEIEAKQ